MKRIEKQDFGMAVSIRLIAALLALIFSASALADKPCFGDTLSFSLGAMSHQGKASFAATRDDAPVDKLSFSDLGFDDSTKVFWGDFTWQFADRWQVSLNYSSFDADGFKSATESGNFGDLDWEIGAALTSSFDMKLYIADITWDFLKTDKAHLGVGVGLHAVDLDLDVLLEVGADIGGSGGTAEVKAEQASALAPLPNISIVGGIMLGEKVYLGGHAGYFSLNYDKYDGELFSIRGALEWRPWKHFGFGAAYQFVDLNVEVDGSSSQEFYDLEFYGPVLFVSAGF